MRNSTEGLSGGLAEEARSQRSAILESKVGLVAQKASHRVSQRPLLIQEGVDFLSQLGGRDTQARDL